MKNTLPINLRMLPFVYRVLLSSPVCWTGRVLLGVIVSVVVVLASPLLVIACVGASVWIMYMSIFNQSGLDRMAQRAKARKLRQGNSDDQLRDQISTI